MKIKIIHTVTSFKDLFDSLNLKEHTLYEVLIQCSSINPEHKSFLFTGFKNGNYCYCYNNHGDPGDPVKVETLYSIKIKKELCSTK